MNHERQKSLFFVAVAENGETNKNRCHREQRQPKSFLFVLEHRFFLILRRLGISHEQLHLTNCTLPKNPIPSLSQRSVRNGYDIDYGNRHKFTVRAFSAAIHHVVLL